MRQTCQMYEKHVEIYTFGDFWGETPTHKSGAQAISKFWGKLKIEFPGNWTKILISPESA